jgi:acyl carrier protein
VRNLVEARSVVAMALNCSFEAVEESAAIGHLQGWDSIGHMSIVLALEGKIGRMLRPSEIGRLKSVTDVAAILSDSSLAKPNLEGYFQR